MAAGTETLASSVLAGGEVGGGFGGGTGRCKPGGGTVAVMQ